MSGNVKYSHRRTTTANKRPLPASINAGEIVLNIEGSQPGAFFKTQAGNVIKLGPMTISASPPTIEGSGSLGYLTGEMWLDTTADVLKIYDGSSFVPCFAGVSITTDPDPPAAPVVGDLWYDDDASDLYIFVGQDTNAWVNIGPGASGGVATVSDTEPTGPVDGQLWFDTTTGFLYVYDANTVSWEIATGGGAAAILDVAFAGAWDGDAVNGPSRNTVYDIFNGPEIEINPDWNLGATANVDVISGGVLDIESGGLLNVSDSGEINININGEFRAVDGATVELDTQVDLQANSTLLAASGATVDLDAAAEVTVPTTAKTDGGTFTDEAASQIFVYEHLPIDTMNARLSIISNYPFVGSGFVTSSDSFYTPYNGRNLWLYNTGDTRWEPWTLTTQITKDISVLAASNVYDVFVYDNGGSLDLEFVGWASFNSRTTSLASQDGVLVKTGELNKRYVGTIQTTAANDLFHRVGGNYNTLAPVGAMYTNWYNPVDAAGYGESTSTESVSAPTILFQPTCAYYQGLIGNADGVNNTPSINYSFTSAASAALIVDYRIRTHNRQTAAVHTEMTAFNTVHTNIQTGGAISNVGRAFGDIYSILTIHPSTGTINDLFIRADFSWKM